MKKRAVVRRMSGYMLVETLAAFTILALALIALYAALGGGARADLHARFQQAAGRVAQAELAALGILRPLSAGAVSGQTDSGLIWTMNVEPYAGADPRGAGAYWAQIVVRTRAAGANPQTLTMTTLKLALPRSAQQPTL